MDLRQVRYLLALAEELNFTRAAERCNISQPPLSRAISLLERQIGVQLFSRDTHRVALTAAGQRLVADARRAVEILDESTALARRIDQGLEGSVTLGFGGSTVYAIVPELVRHFRRAVPHVEIVFRPMPVIHHIDAIHDGTIDIGIVTLPMDDEVIATQLILTEPLGLALPEGHPMLHSRRKAITIPELAKEPFIVYQPARGYHQQADLIALCRLAGFHPRIAHAAPTTEAVIGAVACGEGVALVSASAQRLQMRGVAFRPLNIGKAPKHLRSTHFALAWHNKRLSPAAREFLRRAREVDLRPLSKPFANNVA
jgi:DNA-binding transcriptional LysR family regulator